MLVLSQKPLKKLTGTDRQAGRRTGPYIESDWRSDKKIPQQYYNKTSSKELGCDHIVDSLVIYFSAFNQSVGYEIE